MQFFFSQTLGFKQASSRARTIMTTAIIMMMMMMMMMMMECSINMMEDISKKKYISNIISSG